MSESMYVNNGSQVEFYTEPSDDVLWQIANQNGAIADKVFRGLKHTISRARSSTGYFMAVLFDDNGQVIGCASFVQNRKCVSQWLYTDLWIAPEHRRQGKAKMLLRESIGYLHSHSATSLLCTVSPDNFSSIKTQMSLGFKEIPLKPFGFFEIDDDLLMFELRF